jgi:ankyrin repeat protein
MFLTCFVFSCKFTFLREENKYKLKSLIVQQDGWTPLIAAANNGDAETIQLLLAAHASVNVVNRVR